jgi:two-component system nitrate/nitrite response regulator NarL
VRTIRVIIADDHPVVLQGLLALLCGHRGFEVVKTCAAGTECIDAIRTLLPDVAVIDVHMPGQNGPEVLKFVTANRISTRVIFLAATPTQAGSATLEWMAERIICLSPRDLSIFLHCV